LWWTPVIPASQKVEKGHNPEAGWDKSMRLYLKNQNKKDWGHGSSGRGLPSKHKILSSKSNTVKNQPTKVSVGSFPGNGATFTA
jgi:hypothetical protein